MRRSTRLARSGSRSGVEGRDDPALLRQVDDILVQEATETLRGVAQAKGVDATAARLRLAAMCGSASGARRTSGAGM